MCIRDSRWARARVGPDQDRPGDGPDDQSQVLRRRRCDQRRRDGGSGRRRCQGRRPRHRGVPARREEMKEVRWHARAGQGAKTVSQLLAEAGLLAGSSVQAFPEYGPERRGAPMRAYTRISDKAIRRHDPVASPDIVIVLEPTLVSEMNVAEGLSEDGVVLVDTNELPESLKSCLLYTSDAADDLLCVDLGGR